MENTFKKLDIKKQAAILDACANVIADKGYNKASIATICKKANISNGALYKYFKNKEALLFAIADRGINLMIHDLYVKYGQYNGSIRNTIQNLLIGLTHFAKRYHAYVSIYIDVGSCSMNKIARHISERLEREGRMFFIQLVEVGKKTGEIDNSIRSDLIAYFIDSYVTLYAYSLVSEHYNRRFDSFFKTTGKRLTKQDKITVIIDSIKCFLK
jgi:AcrR family transcriptional regulator